MLMWVSPWLRFSRSGLSPSGNIAPWFPYRRIPLLIRPRRFLLVLAIPLPALYPPTFRPAPALRFGFGGDETDDGALYPLRRIPLITRCRAIPIPTSDVLVS